MMHEHDFDLITTIAEGDLAPDERAAAEASIETCPRCRADLQLQIEALAFLRSPPPVMMTDLERASLHQAVVANLAPAPSPPTLRTAVPWFQRLMPAMAAAAALVVVVGVGSMLVDGSGDGALTVEPTATALRESQSAPADEESAQDSIGSALDDGGAETTTTAAFAAPGLPGIQEYGAITETSLEELATQLKSSAGSEDTVTYSRDSLRSLALDPALVCTETALGEGNVTAIARATVGGDEVEIYRIDDFVDVYSTADCSLLNRID